MTASNRLCRPATHLPRTRWLQRAAAWAAVLALGAQLQVAALAQTPPPMAQPLQVQSASLSKFDVSPDNVQVLFVDLQPELTKQSTSVLPASLAANAQALAKVARLVNVPVTFSIVPLQGKDGRHIPELQRYASRETTFQRVMAGTFMEPPLVAALEAKQRKVLVVSGFATEVAVLQTALGALKAGYTVYVVVDAIGSQSVRTEAAALREMELAGAIPTSVLALAAKLAPDFSQKPGSDVLATFGDLKPPK